MVLRETGETDVGNGSSGKIMGCVVGSVGGMRNVVAVWNRGS